jgi:DNA repair exonuclease SbcCD ATPase subunit
MLWYNIEKQGSCTMILKSLRFSGFKYATDDMEVRHEFFLNTKIYGDNYLGKTTVLEAISWCFTGSNLEGNINFNTQLLNDKSETMFVEVEFEDNNGLKHLLRREKTEKIYISLDGVNTNQDEINKMFINSKNVFLSVLNAEYFLNLSANDARDMMQEILPQIGVDEIYNELPEIHKKAVNPLDLKDTTFYLRRTKSRINELENKAKITIGEISSLKLMPDRDTPKKPAVIDEDAINRNIAQLEEKMIEIKTREVKPKDITELTRNRNFLLDEYNILKSRMQKPLQNTENQTCPTCKQALPKKDNTQLNKEIEKSNKEIEKKMSEIEKKADAVNKEIESLEKENYSKKDMIEESKKNIAEIEANIAIHKRTLADYFRKKSTYNIFMESQESRKKKLDEARKRQDSINKEIREENLRVAAIKVCNQIKLQKQMQNVARYFDRVSIEFERIAKTTGELIPCFNIRYNNRNASLLSNSERIRATLEIANLINKNTKLDIPVFIDNAESITSFDMPDVQLFQAIVKINSPLVVVDGSTEK